MKKVLLVTHVSGFVPQFEMNNVRYLQSQGYEVHYAANFNKVAYGEDNSVLDGTGIICHHIPFEKSPFTVKNVTVYRQLKHLIDEGDFALIHCHTPMGGMMARAAGRKARKSGTRVIYTAHGFHFYKGAPLLNWLLYYPVERLLSYITDVQITINREDYQRAQKFHAGRVVLIPGVGIDTVKLGQTVVEGRAACRAALGIEPGDICILSVGELVKNKNHRAILEALKSFQEEKVKYLICGEGPKRAELEAQIKALGLANRVQLLGYRRDVAKIYDIADIFAFPSFREGLSVALMEAMAKGLPVACSRIRGNRDLIRAKKGGFLFAPNQPDEIRQALGALCASSETRAMMGDYNRQAIAGYDQREVMRIMAQVYDKELGAR